MGFGRGSLGPCKTIQVTKEAAAALGMTGWRRKKLGNAKGEAECFLLPTPAKYFHRYFLRPKFNWGGAE